MVDSYPMNHCPHGKSLREHCDACEKLDLVERHQQERIAQLEAQVDDLLEALKEAVLCIEDLSAETVQQGDGREKSLAIINAAIAWADGKAE